MPLGRRPLSRVGATRYCCYASTVWGSGFPELSFVSVSSTYTMAARSLRGSMPTWNKSSRLRVPGAHPVPSVQITPTWFGFAVTRFCVKLAPLLVVCAR